MYISNLYKFFLNTACNCYSFVHRSVNRFFSIGTGCTSAALRCHQIRVNYTRLTYEEFMAKPLGSIPWDVPDTKFFVNTEGCGYPPRVNCSDFAKRYGYSNLGKIFPCYYSRTNPETVVARYNLSCNYACVRDKYAQRKHETCHVRSESKPNAERSALSSWFLDIYFKSSCPWEITGSALEVYRE